MSIRNRLQTQSAYYLVLLCATAASAPVFAQQQAQIGLEEITVTARRVEENLMQVPLAISAMSANDIQSAGVTNLNELAKFTPGMIDPPGMFAGRSNEPYRRSGTQLTFRGLSVASGLV